MKKIMFLLLLILLICAGITERNIIAESSYDKHPDPYMRVSDLNQLTPDTRKLAEELVERAREEGLPVVIIETYRSQERQEMIYSQGRSAEGHKVTWTLDSMHTKRRAFDIIKEGSDPYGDEDFFERCAEIGEEIALESGHYWSVKDSGHFQNFNFWNHIWY